MAKVSTSRLSAKTVSLLTEKCDSLVATVTERNELTKKALEQQHFTGIAGKANLNTFVVIKYFEFFEAKIKSLHEAALSIIDSCHTWERLEQIPRFVEEKTSTFADDIEGRVQILGGGAPFTVETPNIQTLHSRLNREFKFRAEVAIRNKRKNFLLTSILLPLAFGLLWIVLRK